MVMSVRAAGCLVTREVDGRLEVLLVHPRRASYQRPLFGIPKGLIEAAEADSQTALRETCEETGLKVSVLADLGEITQKSGKVVHAFWATMEPASLDNLDPRGRCISHDGENDVCQFYPIDAARRMMIPAQVEFLDRLLEMRDEARVEYCTPEAPTVRQAPQASKRKQNERRKT